MAKLTAYNIKVKVYCADEKQAKTVQQAANDISNSTDIIGDDIVGFHAYFKRNESLLLPVLKDVMKNGVMAVSRHLITLRRLK